MSDSVWLQNVNILQLERICSEEDFLDERSLMSLMLTFSFFLAANPESSEEDPGGGSRAE